MPRATAQPAATYRQTRASLSYAIMQVTPTRKRSATQLKSAPPGAGKDEARSRPASTAAR